MLDLVWIQPKILCWRPISNNQNGRKQVSTKYLGLHRILISVFNGAYSHKSVFRIVLLGSLAIVHIAYFSEIQEHLFWCISLYLHMILNLRILM